MTTARRNRWNLRDSRHYPLRKVTTSTRVLHSTGKPTEIWKDALECGHTATQIREQGKPTPKARRCRKCDLATR